MKTSEQQIKKEKKHAQLMTRPDTDIDTYAGTVSDTDTVRDSDTDTDTVKNADTYWQLHTNKKQSTV